MSAKPDNGVISPLAVWMLGVCLMLTSATANALTLGELEVNSRLSEPLNATIPLSASQDELANLEVTLASDTVFKRFGIPRTKLLESLKFEVVKQNTTPHIKITSNTALREPLVEFVLAVYSGNGRLLKTFAAFLSP